MLDSSSGADFEGLNSDQKRIKLEEQQIIQGSAPPGKVRSRMSLQCFSNLEGVMPCGSFYSQTWNIIVILASRCKGQAILTTHLHPEWFMPEQFLMDAHINKW